MMKFGKLTSLFNGSTTCVISMRERESKPESNDLPLETQVMLSLLVKVCQSYESTMGLATVCISRNEGKNSSYSWPVETKAPKPKTSK